LPAACRTLPLAISTLLLLLPWLLRQVLLQLPGCGGPYRWLSAAAFLAQLDCCLPGCATAGWQLAEAHLSRAAGAGLLVAWQGDATDGLQEKCRHIR
jgi:hypothetical protein